MRSPTLAGAASSRRPCSRSSGAEVDFFCALGRDADGEAAAAELAARGVRVHAAWRDQPTRTVITLLSRRRRARRSSRSASACSRTAPTNSIGQRLAPPTASTSRPATRAPRDVRGGRRRWSARRAHARLSSTSELEIDALVFSGTDADERRWAHRFEPRTRLMVETEGAGGGRWWGESEGAGRGAAAGRAPGRLRLRGLVRRRADVRAGARLSRRGRSRGSAPNAGPHG